MTLSTLSSWNYGAIVPRGHASLFELVSTVCDNGSTRTVASHESHKAMASRSSGGCTVVAIW